MSKNRIRITHLSPLLSLLANLQTTVRGTPGAIHRDVVVMRRRGALAVEDTTLHEVSRHLLRLDTVFGCSHFSLLETSFVVFLLLLLLLVLLILDYRTHGQSEGYEECLLLLPTLPPVGSFYRQGMFPYNPGKCDYAES